MTTQKSNTPFKKTDFYKRLKKRNEINKQLNESVRTIIHCDNSKYTKWYWRNCLKDLHDLILDKVHHYIAEKDIWSDALEDEILVEFTTRFPNGEDLKADCIDYCLNESRGYNDSLMKEFIKELNWLFDPYIKKPIKRLCSFEPSYYWVGSHAFQAPPGLASLYYMDNKRKLQHEVNSLLHYINWRLQNAFDVVVLSVITLSNNIKSQLNGEGDFSYFNLLQYPNSVPFQSLTESMIPDEECEEMTIEIHKKANIVLCKGCDSNERNNTILKHLKHPSVNCIQSYSQIEIMQLESNSKLCHNEQISEYKRAKNITRSLDEEIQKMFHSCGANLETVYDELMKYLCHTSRLRKKWIGLWSEKLNEANCKFSNVKDVTEDIAMLKTKLDAEIMETYNHLRTEIDMEIGPYITHDGSENSYLNHKDGEDHDEKEYIIYIIMDNTIQQKRSKLSIQYEAKSLLHYMKWRLQNSLDLIVEETKSMALGITRQLSSCNKDFFKWFLKTLKQPVLEPYEILTKGYMGRINPYPYHHRKYEEHEPRNLTMGIICKGVYSYGYGQGYQLLQNPSWYCPCTTCVKYCNWTQEDYYENLACRPNYNLVIPIDQLNLNARV